VKNGRFRGVQRYVCKSCGRSFSLNRLKPSRKKRRQKEKALEMYLNSVGIRKIARFLKVSPGSILNWIQSASPKKQTSVHKEKEELEDCIEMDEIYTFVKKKQPSSGVDGLLSQRRAGDCLCDWTRTKCCEGTLCLSQGTTSTHSED